ncbi:MAG: enoyl-CoA hydratase/isomerase family protein [Bacteroidetes bacterium]|nr:enoyl-CoA hydratase/isomerase family protein [Bacteroidota bacterium]
MVTLNQDPDGISTITFDLPNSPVNVVNPAVIDAFDDCVSRALADKDVKGLILASAKKDFIVGGDLNGLRNVTKAEDIINVTRKLHALFRKMETGGKPVVAAINGTAVGGGYEVCLACHYRIAVNNPGMQIGLPEVLLGLLPGGGGTQRLPRLIGIQESLPFLLEGKKLRPEEALKKGLVNALVNTQEELRPAAKQWILGSPPLQSPDPGKCIQPWDKKEFRIPGGGVNSPNNAMMLSVAGGLLMKKTFGNYPAPQAILNSVYEGLQLPFDRALEVELRYFAKCVMSVEAKNLIRTLFFVKNEADKGIARPTDIPAADIKKIGILGAGMMGAGIAYAAASAGTEVVLKDVSKENADKGKGYSEKLLNEKLSKNQTTKEKVENILNKISTTGNPADMAGCDLVIEAVFENRELKATVTKESEAVLSKNAVFASNTSTLPITGLAKASARPENFIGLHFFSPVDKMPLIEVIVGKKTSNYAIAVAIDFIRKIKKTPIVVNDSRGFYTSRVFASYLYEGFEMLAEGIAPALIENAGKAAGMPVGPLALADEVAIDLIYKILKQTEEDTGKQRTDASVSIPMRFVEEFKRVGKKDRKGFYEYPADGKKYLWKELTKIFPPAENQPEVTILKKRLLYIQSLEAIKCLEENVVVKPSDADLGSILGWGFPAYTGGVISLIEMVGKEKFAEECKVLAKKYGRRFRPIKHTQTAS